MLPWTQSTDSPQKSASGKELQHVELALLSVASLVWTSTAILLPELTIWQPPYTENLVRNKEFAICWFFQASEHEPAALIRAGVS